MKCGSKYSCGLVNDVKLILIIMIYIKHERPCLATFPNTKKRVDNMTCSRIFLTNFEVFGNVIKHCLECLIYLLNQK